MSNENNNEDFLDFFAKKVAKHIAQFTAPQPQNNSTDEEEFFNTNQAKEYLNISSTATLRSYVVKGFIPKPKKVGGRKLVYKKSDLKNYLSNG